MSSKAQISANRKNAKNSKGPTTPIGKKIVAQNALKHGVFSKQVVLGNESQEEFDALQQEFYNHFNPQGLLEELFCQRAVSAAWRLSRITLMETMLFNQARVSGLGYFDEVSTLPLNNQLSLLSRYEISMERTLFRSIEELRALQEARQGSSEIGFVPQNLIEDLHSET